MAPFSKVLDLFLPPRCISCQKMVVDQHTLCQACWERARFLSNPCCDLCGLPFEYDVPDRALCLDCAMRAPPFSAARAVFPYDDFSRDLILGFKHGDRTDLAPAFGTWMCRSATKLIEQSEYVVPVPLHWRRLMKRRYNQAGLLAQEIARQSGLKYEPALLKRIRHTAVQGHLSRMARQKNLQGAFQIIGDIDGARILLVDDVLTTGATVLGCTNALLRAGAAEVRVITLARVLPEFC